MKIREGVGFTHDVVWEAASVSHGVLALSSERRKLHLGD
jgi:hypothetical protein